ncbi:hypothetical protein HMPREF1985_00981 [Mitsuokella sp. oral taxon 131 str. W9106]|nr:hypothetical protein HMPREF1985_00981 [Mitsuokella sp. oral taxon 131 str. W9106]
MRVEHCNRRWKLIAGQMMIGDDDIELFFHGLDIFYRCYATVHGDEQIAIWGKHFKRISIESISFCHTIGNIKVCIGTKLTKIM